MSESSKSVLSEIQKAPEKNKNIQAGEKIYTLREARKKFYPDDFKHPPHTFVAQKADREMVVPATPVKLPTTIKIWSPRDNRAIIFGEISFGGYVIKFKNHYYTSQNLLEYQALLNKPGIVCTGPQEQDKELSDEAKALLNG